MPALRERSCHWPSLAGGPPARTSVRGRSPERGHVKCPRLKTPARPLPPQDLHQLLELQPHLLDDLLALRHVRARFLAGQLVAGAADREALIVEEAPDLADDDHVLALVVAAVAAALHRLQLRELLLPVAQHVRLDAAQLAHLADGEVALAGNRRQLRIILWLQHRLR